MRSFKRKLPYFVLTRLSAGRRVKNIYVKNETATNDTDRSPVIIAANHTNSHDMPILLKAYGDNAVFLLGKQRLGLLDWLFFWLNGAVFTDRLDRKDTRITKKVLIELLKNKKTIVWFPEGTWNMTENLPMLPMKWGIIEVAREAGANILPAFLSYDNEKESDKVKLCEIQTHPDDDNRLIAHVVWENEVKELLKLQPEKEDDLLREIQEEVREDLNIEASVPRCFCVWDSFPRAHSGKRDISRIKKSKENLRIV